MSRSPGPSVLVLIGCLTAVSACQRLFPDGTTSPGARFVARGPTASVIVALRVIEPGVAIQPDDIAARPMLLGPAAAEHTFSSPADVVGQVARERILANEPVRAERLHSETPERGIAAIVRVDARAFVLPLSEEEGRSELLIPGSFVDISFAPDPARTRDPHADGAHWVAQGTRLLAVGQTVVKGYGAVWTSERRDPSTVTLELPPDELAALLTARAAGVIHVSLRSVLDILLAPDHPPTLLQLRAGPPPTP